MGSCSIKAKRRSFNVQGGKAGNFTIPASVTTIDYRAFRDGAGLTSITVEAGNALFSSLDGVLFDKNRTTLVRCPEGRTGRYTIPNNVTHIGELAFAACAGLTEITIPATVAAIGMQAFAGCTSLTEIYFLGDAPFPHRPFYTGVVPTIYYLPGTTGWRDYFYGRPTVLWDPQIQTSDGSFGVQSNQFGFNITASSELTVVVEASVELDRSNLGCGRNQHVGRRHRLLQRSRLDGSSRALLPPPLAVSRPSPSRIALLVVSMSAETAHSLRQPRR